VRYRFDLTLSMTDGQTTARAGEHLTYTLRITNTSSYPVTATGVTIVDYLEPGLPDLTSTVLSYSGGTPGWSYAGSDGDYAMYEYAVGALGPNQSRTITMAVQVINPLPAGVLAVRNSAEIVDDGAGGVESDPTNQTASDTDIVAGADLAITGLSLLSQAGQQATVIVTVTNQGVDATLGPDGVGWFGTDLYVKPAGSSAPLGPQDRYLGACPTATNYCPNDIRWSLYQITNPHGGAGLAPGESWVLTYTTALPAGNEFWLYAQTDTFWGEKGDPDPTMFGSSQHGRLVEADEANNISGVLIVRTGSRVFLPLVVKNR
jgi:uncharacterized repeat protein (TIGR01451 family)